MVLKSRLWRPCVWCSGISIAFVLGMMLSIIGCSQSDASYKQLVYEAPILDVALTTRSDLLAVVGEDGLIAIDRRDGIPSSVETRRFAGNIQTVAFHPSGELMAVGERDGKVGLWDINTGSFMYIHDIAAERRNFVYDVTFSPDGNMLAAGDWYGTIWLWDTVNGDLIRKLQGHTLVGQARAVNSLLFGPNGDILASAGSDGSIHIWSATNGLLMQKFSIENNHSPISSIAFTPDGKTIISGAYDGHVRQWPITNDAVPETLIEHDSAVFDIAVNSSGCMIAIGGGALIDDGRHIGSHNTTIVVMDTVSEKIITLNGHRDSVQGLVFSLDGKQLISGSYDHTVRFWRVSEFEE